MHGSRWILSIVAAFSAAAVTLAPAARAEDVVGYVTTQPLPPDFDFEAGGPPAPPGTFVFVERLDVPPEAAFQTGTFTGANGTFVVPGLEPGFTYSFRVPQLELQPGTTVACPYALLLTPPGLPSAPPILLPRGLTVPPGPPSNIHLKAQPCSAASPCFLERVAPDLGLASMFLVDEPQAPLSLPQAPRVTHGGTCYDPPYFAIDRAVEFTLTWLDHPERAPLVTSVGEAFGGRSPLRPASQLAAVFTAQPLAVGERVRIAYDPTQPVLAGFIPFGPTSVDLGVGAAPPDLPEATFYVRPVWTMAGRVFAELDVANGRFDGADVPLEGVEVEIRDLLRPPPDGIDPRRTRTGADGRYAFPGLPSGTYAVEVLTGPPPRRTEFRRLAADANVDADFAYLPDACPHLACASGDLHEVTLEATLPLGDPTVLVLEASLRDGEPGGALRDRVLADWTGAFPGPAVGPNGALRVEGVAVAGGLATVRLRLVAQGAAFPGGFFGATPKRVRVTLNGLVAQAHAPLRCETAAVGVDLANDPRGPRGGAEPFTVRDAWGYDGWRRCHPLGGCVDASASAEGGANLVDVEVEVWRRVPRGGPRTAEVVFASGRRALDRVRLRLDGAPWSGTATGDRGLLTVTRVARTAEGTWRVRARVQTPDRADGNPGALPPGEYHVDVDLAGAKGGAWFDLADLTVPGDHLGWAGDFLYRVFAFRNALDAAACR